MADLPNLEKYHRSFIIITQDKLRENQRFLRYKCCAKGCRGRLGRFAVLFSVGPHLKTLAQNAPYGSAVIKDAFENLWLGRPFGSEISCDSHTLATNGAQVAFFLAKFGTDDCTLSLPTVIETKISVGPNPVKDILHVSDFNEFETYKVFDASGKLLQSGNLHSNIDCSAFAGGLYIIEFSGNSKKHTLKIIKE